LACTVEVDLRNNKGVVKDKTPVEWEHPHGTSVEFTFDGRIQLNGEAGILNYLKGNILVNPHLGLKYTLPETPSEVIPRVATIVPQIPPATEPHPHTMKLGEFIHHASLFGRAKVETWLQKGFSRLGPAVLQEIVKTNPSLKGIRDKMLSTLSEKQFSDLFSAIQKAPLKAPATSSVMSIGEDALARSILRMGQIDFFSVVSRKPTICDLKPIQVEVAVARLLQKGGEDESVQVLRFANRVPLQFDKAACAIVKAITSINWRSYGMNQPKNGLPTGPYIIAVSVVSPFIKFKNASKETIDASDELVEELRRALMQAGQRLSRHLNRENRAAELEQRIQHIEQFGPVLVDILCRITKAPATRRKKAEDGLSRILERDAKVAKKMLSQAETELETALEAGKVKAARTQESQDEGDKPHKE
jgi:DNA topoisomerase-6 subunit B